MYSNKLVVAVKHNGKILREKLNHIFLPFNSEYSLLVKNLNTRKVSVNVSIDSDDVLDGHSLLIQPNSETELKGFLRGTTAKNKFKFIEKTKEISDHRGDRIDDGLIRVEFAFEKEKPEVVHHYHEHHDYWWPRKPWRPWNSWDCEPYARYTVNDRSFTTHDNSTSDKHLGSTTFTCSNNLADLVGAQVLSVNEVQNEEGITVKGSEVNQAFNYGYIGELENKHVMVIKLRGEKNNGTVIEKPVTVRTRVVCPTCGKKSRSDLKYCSTCGTFLN